MQILAGLYDPSYIMPDEYSFIVLFFMYLSNAACRLGVISEI